MGKVKRAKAASDQKKHGVHSGTVMMTMTMNVT
jgi:hypothetical protein